MNIYKPNSFTNTNATTSVVIRKNKERKKRKELTKINDRLMSSMSCDQITLYKVRGFTRVVFGMPVTFR